ncbi:cytochrome C oxidase subunit IV family protein [Paramagnetospirillum magneticum]|nr:cytochrome C oxidase subunit IV family protein [Paramagnetospirillum magneticum]
MPSTTTLLRAWGLMMALTALSLWAAIADQGIAPTLAAMAAGVLKAVLILWVYLNLRKSGSGWKSVFIAFLAVIAAIVVGADLVGRLR